MLISKSFCKRLIGGEKSKGAKEEDCGKPKERSIVKVKEVVA